MWRGLSSVPVRHLQDVVQRDIDSGQDTTCPTEHFAAILFRTQIRCILEIPMGGAHRQVLRAGQR
jgi:hypothetical protein